MKTAKRILSVLLVVLMLITSIPVANLLGVEIGVISEAASYSVGDIIQFGSYPQSEVKDESLINEPNALAPVWDEWWYYGYYSGEGYGTMQRGDWMRYIDVTYNGSSYRGVKFTQYRPRLSTWEPDIYNSAQHENGYYTDIIYWFKYDPLNWRVLDPNTGLVICENIIDSQAFSDTIYCDDDAEDSRYAHFNDEDFTYYASDYETSSINQWLNDDFYNTAFSESEQKTVASVTLENKGYYTSVGTTGFEALDSNKVYEKVFLLSYDEARNKDYGYLGSGWEDIARRAKGSDYAKCQGLRVCNDISSDCYGNSEWFLRSSGSISYYCCAVNYKGLTSNYSCAAEYTELGIRPAIILKSIFNTKFENEEYQIGDIIQMGSYPQSEVIDESLISELNNMAPDWEQWTSYGYYSGDGTHGSMKQGDWMRYTDVVYNGSKYRGVKFTSYRPGIVFDEAVDYNSLQDERGYYTNNIYWFKFESIDWRVLDPATGFIMCETIIDSQHYSNTIYDKEGASGFLAHFSDPDFKNYASDFATSSIRKWLNKDFYNTAFNALEKEKIAYSENDNLSYHTLDDFTDYVTGYEVLDGEKTKDKIFLLSYIDVINYEYGLSTDYIDCTTATFASDYAKCQGIRVSQDEYSNTYGNSPWILRTPGLSSFGPCSVNPDGSRDQWSETDYSGIRPVLRLKKTYGSVSNDEVVDGYKRYHVVQNWKKLNQSYITEYLAGNAVPMDGTNGNPDYTIPGQAENMIPQGLAYWPEKDWVLISSYDKNGKNPSVIFALDRSTGVFVAQFNLKKKDGDNIVDWMPHAGGIGVSENNLYITSSHGVAYFPLSDLDVESGTVKDIVRAGSMAFGQLGEAYAAYVNVCDGMLFAGNFYSNYPLETLEEAILEALNILPPSWDTPAAYDYNSLVLGFKLSGENSKDEWNNLKALKDAATYRIGIDDSLQCVQGIAFKKMGDGTYKMYLSRTTDVSFGASISAATVTLNKTDINVKENKFSYYKNLPGTEGITFIGDDLHILYESGALSICDSIIDVALWNGLLKNCTDVIWQISETDLLQIPYADDSWFEYNAYVNTNIDIARFCADYCNLGYCYNKKEIKYYLEKSGFSLRSCDMSSERDEVNYFIADKTITTNGKERTLIFVGCIGSYKDQWYSNFDPAGKDNLHNYADPKENEGIHLGFANAREFVYGKLKDYIAENNIDISSASLLLTGHSRGSATVNLLAAKLIDDNIKAEEDSDYVPEININRNRIYTYGFATPNTALTTKSLNNERYKSIINIVNPEDLVTKLIPTAWGYGRYGTTYTLPSKTNYNVANSTYLEDVQKYTLLNGNDVQYEPYDQGEVAVYNFVEDMTSHLKDMTDFYEKKDIYTFNTTYNLFKETLLPFVAGGKNWVDYLAAIATLLTKPLTFQRAAVAFFFDHQFIEPEFEDAHSMKTYAAFVKTLDASVLFTKRAGYKGTVNCPVDVEIYDKHTGQLVGKITNNVVDEEVAAQKNAIIMTVDGDSKSFWLPSNGDFEIKLIGNGEGAMDYTMSEIDSDIGEVKRVNFFDVEITDDLTMVADVNVEDFDVEEHKLIFEDGETLEPTEILNEEEISIYNIEINTTRGGSANTSQTAKSGDYVNVNATANAGWDFDGWYENGKLVSTDKEYSFVVKSDRNLEARFKHISHSFGEWYIMTPATCEKSGVQQRNCIICETYSETQEIVATDHSFASGQSKCNNCSYNKADSCSCKCHSTSFITKLIWKITIFFNKLLRKNKECACGIYHY